MKERFVCKSTSWTTIFLISTRRGASSQNKKRTGLPVQRPAFQRRSPAGDSRPVVNLPSGGHVTTSDDIIGYHDAGEGEVKARDATEHSMIHRTAPHSPTPWGRRTIQPQTSVMLRLKNSAFSQVTSHHSIFSFLTWKRATTCLMEVKMF